MEKTHRLIDEMMVIDTGESEVMNRSRLDSIMGLLVYVTRT